LSSFVSEDGATIGAATLAATGVLDPRVAFPSVFAGLWAGDLSIYALSRKIGPPIMSHRWFSRWFRGEQSPSNADERF
jgi:membrane protein DedA with SNARE-associated domain